MGYWKTPRLIIRFFRNLEWHYSRNEKTIYLTFDDGPTPVITDQVLDILNRFNAKATFFCLGRNVERNPGVYKRILSEGHSVGNHTYSHLRGWKTPVKSYIHDTNLASTFIDSKLFRPPYGRIRRLQVRMLSKNYRIVMWDVLSHDYNQKLPEKWCLKYIMKNTRNGSIVVFHDSQKASKNLLYTLPKYLEHFSSLGFTFKAIR